MALRLIWLVVIGVVAFLSAHGFGCFITNCPPGGKRTPKLLEPPPPPPPMPNPASGATLADRPSAVQLEQLVYRVSQGGRCQSCGDGGHCQGPHLCCGPSIGCRFGTKDARVCSGSAWKAPGSCPTTACRRDPRAVCATVGLCCSSIGRCHVDPLCLRSRFGQSR